ncbi:MAG: hypothetical protein J6A36_04555 [Clostridia bacterium]|nr:hypothetical protein [Clostridia bacterium]
MKFNVHFFVMLLIASVISVADILIYVFKLDYWLAIAISFAIATCIIFINRKKIKIKTDFEKYDIIMFIMLVLTLLAKVFLADEVWDTNNYHIYLQETPFIDKINFDFFPGRTINSFLFPLGDRMHYFFRLIFGYRFGTILSWYAVIVAYYQTKSLIRTVSKSNSKYIPIYANLCYLIHVIYGYICVYHIDLLSMIFILELVYIAFEKENFIKDKQTLYLSFLYSGIATGIKVSNIIIIFVLYFFILVKNIKNLKDIKIQDIPICIILFVLPFGTYAYDNFIQTGSILFPYYNNIFKSRYFANISWHDINFGLPNILYALVWPILISIDPLLGYDYYVYDFSWLMGYVVTISYIIYALIKHKNIKEDKVFQLSILSLIISIVWAKFLMGYARYACYIPILYIVIFASIGIKLEKVDIDKETNKKVYR